MTTIVRPLEPVGTRVVSATTQARAAWERANGDVESAVAMLTAWAFKDPDLLNDLVRVACRHLLRTVISTDRNTISKAIGKERPVPGPQARGAQALVDLAASHMSILDAYYLSDGDLGQVALGDATKPIVLLNADIHERNARGNVLNCRWLRTIADEMGDARRVRDAFSAAQVERIKQRARETIEGKTI